LEEKLVETLIIVRGEQGKEEDDEETSSEDYTTPPRKRTEWCHIRVRAEVC
jgi:hypothetical protein